MSTNQSAATPPDVPDEVRAQAAEAYEDVYPAVKDGRWQDGSEAGRRVLRLLQKYPSADQAHHFRMEKAWSYFAIGMHARAAGTLKEAALHLRKAADMLPGRRHPSINVEALNQLALVQADMDDLKAAAATYHEALTLFAVEDRQAQAILWLGLGRVRERLGSREDRIGAIHAYSTAISTGRGPSGTDVAEWTYDAHAGIVRCCFADSGGQRQPFWYPWLGSSKGPRFCFWVLAALAGVLFLWSVVSVALSEYTQAGWLLGLFAVPVLVILLPSLRRASGPGWAVELQAHPGVQLAFDLKKPSGEELD